MRLKGQEKPHGYLLGHKTELSRGIGYGQRDRTSLPGHQACTHGNQPVGHPAGPHSHVKGLSSPSSCTPKLEMVQAAISPVTINHKKNDRAVTKAASPTSQQVQGQCEDPSTVCFQGILHLLSSESPLSESHTTHRTASTASVRLEVAVALPAGRMPSCTSHTTCSCAGTAALHLTGDPHGGDLSYLNPLPSLSHSGLLFPISFWFLFSQSSSS